MNSKVILMNKIEIYKFFNTYQAKIDEHTHLCDVHKDLAEYILALQKENEQLQEKNENYRASVQALKIENDKKDRIIKEAIDYINTAQYSDVSGLHKYSIFSVWLILFCICAIFFFFYPFSPRQFLQFLWA